MVFYARSRSGLRYFETTLVIFHSAASLIRTVTSCAGVISKSLDEKQNTEYTALVYAMLHQFDIDGSDYFISAKWFVKLDLLFGI